MQALARNGYTAESVKAALHSGVRELHFAYELLNASNLHQGWLGGVIKGAVANNALADIKRKAMFVIRDGIDDIDYLSDRIRPHVKLKMPDGGFAWFPQGVFLLTTPPRVLSDGDVVTREVEAYDQLIILRDDKVEDRYRIEAGANYITGPGAVKDLLVGAGITKLNLTPTTTTLPADKEWEPGTTKLTIVNDLLGAINFQSLFFDEQGRAVARVYRSPAEAPIEYTYADDDDSVMFQNAFDEFDLFDIANKWVLVVSDPERPALSATYTNSNPASPTSTASRDRTIVDFRNDVDAANQTTLNAKAERLAFNASQVFNAVEFSTAIMPHHSEADVLRLINSRLGISARYSEHTWEYELAAGARMAHRVRRVVTV
jgi:hypothetical protein